MLASSGSLVVISLFWIEFFGLLLSMLVFSSMVLNLCFEGIVGGFLG